MKNEYGVELDRNGYAPSILQEGDECYLCYRRGMRLQRHEVFHGSDRSKSKSLGLWVGLCYTCHYAIHNSDGVMDRVLKERAQVIAERHYGWTHDDFRERFRKSYL